MTNGNGLTQALPPTQGLPPAREAVVEQGLRIQQATAAERDRLIDMLSQRDTEIASLKAMLDVAELSVTTMESRVLTATLTRDEAVARRAEVETVLASMLALGRAFQIKSTPLITGNDEHAQTPQDHKLGSAVGAVERYAATRDR